MMYTTNWVRHASAGMLASGADDFSVQMVCKAADRYEKLRKLSPRQYAELHERSLHGEHFDDLVDRLEG